MKKVIVFLVYLICLRETVLAGNETTIHAGIFTIDVDPGHPFNYNVSGPDKSDSLSGQTMTVYIIELGNGTLLIPIKYEEANFDLKDAFGSQTLKRDLINEGVDKDSISEFERKIDSKPGALAQGYLSETDSTIYYAGYYISKKSICWILGYNYDEMLSVLKTIHITET